MKRLTFNAPANHVLVYDDGKEVHGGEEFSVGNDRADQLLADPNASVGVPVQELGKLSRDELNEHARQAGIDAPESLSSKDEVLGALTDEGPEEPE